MFFGTLFANTVMNTLILKNKISQLSKMNLVFNIYTCTCTFKMSIGFKDSKFIISTSPNYKKQKELNKNLLQIISYNSINL